MFEDSANENDFDRLNWSAINAKYWQQVRDEKQAEFLLEQYFPWRLVEVIGVINSDTAQTIATILKQHPGHQPKVQVHRDWYY